MCPLSEFFVVEGIKIYLLLFPLAELNSVFHSFMHCLIYEIFDEFLEKYVYNITFDWYVKKKNNINNNYGFVFLFFILLIYRK